MDKDVAVSKGQGPAWKRFAPIRIFENYLGRIEDWLNLISVLIVMFLMLFSTAEILGRYLLNSPIPGHVEIVELIMAGIVFFGIAYTERVGGHVRMEFFITRVLKGRAYHSAEAITAGLALFVYLFILVYSFKNAVFALQIGDTTAELYWPTWPSKFAVPFGSLFLCIRFVIEIIQHVLQGIAGVEMRDLQG